jgi:hypothetical protein
VQWTLTDFGKDVFLTSVPFQLDLTQHLAEEKSKASRNLYVVSDRSEVMQRLVLGFCSPAPQKLGHFPQLEGKS